MPFCVSRFAIRFHCPPKTVFVTKNRTKRVKKNQFTRICGITQDPLYVTQSRGNCTKTNMVLSVDAALPISMINALSPQFAHVQTLLQELHAAAILRVAARHNPSENFRCFLYTKAIHQRSQIEKQEQRIPYKTSSACHELSSLLS